MPKIIPGKFEMIIGQSFRGAVHPYSTQSTASRPVTSGWIGDTGFPVKFAIICGMYATYIEMHMTVATSLIILCSRSRLGAALSSELLSVSIRVKSPFLVPIECNAQRNATQIWGLCHAQLCSFTASKYPEFLLKTATTKDRY